MTVMMVVEMVQREHHCQTSVANRRRLCQIRGIVTRLGYGAGQLVEGVKTAAFTFVFFFYTQVLGVPAGPAGLVLLIATIWDAISDPLMGSISDRARYRLGRRHPYMYAAAVPLGLAYVAMFLPPASASSTTLLLWLAVSALLVRTAMTVFHVPYLALGAELSSDYTERTAIVGARTAFGMGGLALMLALAWGWFFRATPEFANGQLNPAAYPGFAIACGLAATAAALVAGASTHRRIPQLPTAAPSTQRLSIAAVVADWRLALSNQSFRALFIGLIAFGTMRGVQETLSIHLYTYYWRLAASEILGVFLVGILALLAAIPFWTAVARRTDKKPVLQTGALLFTVTLAIVSTAPLVGLFPARESAAFLPVLLAAYGVAGFSASAVFVASGSMLADVVDEIESTSGQRLAGVLFGASALSFKVTTGLGGLLGGLALSAMAFPAGADPASVPAVVSRWLAIAYGPVAGLCGGIAAVSFARYTLTRGFFRTAARD